MSKLGGLTITWLGHATLHIETPAGTSILVDPWITANPKFPTGSEDFGKIDLMLLTHGHSDHTGDAVPLAQKYDPTVVAIVELGDLLATQGIAAGKIAAMNIGGRQRFADLEISMVEARHSSSLVIDGKPVYAGEPAGFVLKFDRGPTIYLAGDTGLFSDMQLIRELYAPDIAVLPIGDYYTMGAAHAAIAARWIGAAVVLPIHWGTFPALPGTPQELAAALSKKPIEVIEMTPGIALT